MPKLPDSVVIAGLLLLLAVVTVPAAFSTDEQPPAPITEAYPLYNIRVIDGDTLAGDITFTRAIPSYELPWNVRFEERLETITLRNQRIRALDCDAMETKTLVGQRAKVSLKKLLSREGMQVTIIPSDLSSLGDKGVRGGKHDSFGRLLAHVYVHSPNADPLKLEDWLREKKFLKYQNPPSRSDPAGVSP